MSPAYPEQLAERYIASVDAHHRCAARGAGRGAGFPGIRADVVGAYTGFHVADIDQMLGLRLRRILGEDNPQFAGVDTQASVKLYRRTRMDIGLAIDCLGATSSVNSGLMEMLTPDAMVRKGRHSEGHELSAADLAACMAMHIEAHIKQIKRVMKAASR